MFNVKQKSLIEQKLYFYKKLPLLSSIIESMHFKRPIPLVDMTLQHLDYIFIQNTSVALPARQRVLAQYSSYSL